MEKRALIDHRQLIHWGALSLFAMALCYVVLFVIYGAVLSFPADTEVGGRIAYLIEQKSLIKASYVVGYIMFACLLCICIQAIHAMCKQASPILINTATLFGLFWVVVLLCTGMIAITSAELIASMHATNNAASEIVYYASLVMVESLGGGIELLGGIWVFLLGIIGWRHHLFSRAFCIFSLVKGLIGIATILLNESILLDVFGLSGIVWFIWLGVLLLKHNAR